jgi:hypothetical protein
MLSWTVQRPSPESADRPGDVGELLAFLEGALGKFQQPRAHDAALVPQMRQGVQVKGVFGRGMEQFKPSA